MSRNAIATLGVFALVLVFAGFGSVLATRPPARTVFRCNDPLALRTIELMADKDGWEGYGSYVILYRKRVGVWVANNAYGLGIRAGDLAEFARPDDGSLSGPCRAAVWQQFLRVFVKPANDAQRAESLAALRNDLK